MYFRSTIGMMNHDFVWLLHFLVQSLAHNRPWIFYNGKLSIYGKGHIPLQKLSLRHVVNHTNMYVDRVPYLKIGKFIGIKEPNPLWWGKGEENITTLLYT